VTQLLQQMLTEVEKLSAREQDAIAAYILVLVEDKRSWNEAFAQPQDQLTRMAAKVRDDISAERVKGGGIDEL